MNIERLAQLVYEISFAAGMNQQYFQTQEDHFSSEDRILRGSIAIIALISLVVTCVGEFQKKHRLSAAEEIAPPRPASKWIAAFSRVLSWWHTFSWSVKVSVVAAIVAAIVNVCPAADNARRHGAIYRQWTLLRQQADKLLFDIDSLSEKTGDASEAFNARYHILLDLRAQIEADEPNPDMQLVQKCYEAESERRLGKGVKTMKQREEAVQKQVSLR